MYCPKCDAKTKVINSRYGAKKTKRRRECTKCTYRFNTIEKDAEDKSIQVNG
jgi:transcriptional regulator NrdR family protein